MSLETLVKISEAVGRRPEELARARNQGQKVVGWLGYNIPEELIHALGLIPVRLGTGGDGKLVEVGSRYISSKNCVYTRNLVGLFAENTDPYIQNSDLIALDSTCLQLYRVGEIIHYYFNINTLTLGVPRNFFLPEAKKYFQAELEEFAGKLEGFAGKKLDAKSLSESIKLFNGIREKIKNIYKFQSEDSPVITWSEVYNVVHAGYYLDREQYSAYLSELLQELEEKHRNRNIDIEEEEARVLLAGSSIPPGDNKIIKIIEDLGGRIVGDDLWTGILPYLGIDIQESSIKGLADAYLKRVPHGALPYLDLNTDKRLQNLRESIKSNNARGIIYYTLRYCDPYTFKAGETKDVVKQDDVTLLEIHTEYAGSDFEAIRTRVGAFLEMLRSGI
ncbi:benzoyl-CoA reductase subunit C [Ruminiclostridium hungatei]|uniref:Benzoyl-CoA reductase subunit C n=1 Tax=Ruminiclostridium hungatei TaxID=48256 RepID=A0A1V4SM45_RUMHU|nr:2-hydroxyacyl-CoA dehydratase family protein [Ruminiclostridium hungatei]OPX44962.1 benzoyl-CoA reductase subunit C [Ruminiclostridium hungatei]